MTVSIKIVPFSDTIDMYGDADRSAAYSLSGHVVITLSSLATWFERRRAVRLLLQSLVVTFEGQSELITQEIGYTSCRLCAISQELITEDPVELSNEGQEEADGSCVWNVVFNLTIPGWLPASSVFGDCITKEAGTSYGLYATAKFLDADTSISTSWWAACYASFRGRTRDVCAPRCDIQLNRYTISDPSSSNSSTSSVVDYMVFAKPPQTEAQRTATTIPLDILSKVCVVAAVPEKIPAEDSTFPFCLRVRTKDLPESECKRLRITDFTIDIEQTERYRRLSSSNYAARYPIPPAAEQPPAVPLRDPHPLQHLYELGLATFPSHGRSYHRAFSLLHPEHSGRFALSGDGYAFRHDADPDRAGTWYSMRTDIPFIHELGLSKAEQEEAAICPAKLRVSQYSPLFAVEHKLYVSLTCTYDLTDGEDPERATERLQFHIPLRFALPAPAPAPAPLVIPLYMSPPSWQGHSPASSVDSVSSVTPLFSGNASSPVSSQPYAQTLPAYSQLFDAYGNDKIDLSVPLPLYTPKPSSECLSL